MLSRVQPTALEKKRLQYSLLLDMSSVSYSSIHVYNLHAKYNSTNIDMHIIKTLKIFRSQNDLRNNINNKI